MSVSDPTKAKKCGKRTRAGGTCMRWAMHGQNVCDFHGGKAPRALKNAEARLRDLVHPAISSLARQIDADEFNAVRYVLDWAGYRPALDTPSADIPTVRVTVLFDRADDDQQPPPTLSLTDGA